MGCQCCCLSCLLTGQSQLCNNILCSYPHFFKKIIHNANCLANKSSHKHLMQIYLYKLVYFVLICLISRPYLVILSHRSAQHFFCLVCTNRLTLSIYFLLLRSNKISVHKNSNYYVHIPNQPYIRCYFNLHPITLKLRRSYEKLFICLFIFYDYKLFGLVDFLLICTTVDSCIIAKYILLHDNFNQKAQCKYFYFSFVLPQFYNFTLLILLHALCSYIYLFFYFIYFTLVSLNVSFTSYVNTIMHLSANRELTKIKKVLIFTKITLFYLVLYKNYFLSIYLDCDTYFCMYYTIYVLKTWEFGVNNQILFYLCVCINIYINVYYFSSYITLFIIKNDL